MLLLFLLALGLSGINVSIIQTALAESVDDNVSSEKREEQTQRHSAARRARAHRKSAKRIFVCRTQLFSKARQARLSFTSLSPPHYTTGNLHGRLQVFRI